MSDHKEETGKKTLSLSKQLDGKKIVNISQVRQSFSHGRSKTVAVEVKRRRPLVKDEAPTSAKEEAVEFIESTPIVEQAAPSAPPTPAAAPTSSIPAGLTSQEWEARLRAVQDARKAETERSKLVAEKAKLEAEEAQRREEEARRRAEEKEHVETLRTLDKPEGQSEAHETLSDGPSQAEPSARESHPTPHHKKPDLAMEEEEFESKSRRGKVDAKKSTLRLKSGDAQRRRNEKLVIQHALDGEADDERGRSLASLKRAREKERLRQIALLNEGQKIIREVIIPETITVQELSNRMAIRAADVIKALMKMGMMATINQPIDADTAELIVVEFGHTPKRVAESDIEEGIITAEDDPSLLNPRAPVVTIMGHVDHGKTSLLDALRETDVAAHEAGGITQHIGAYQVHLKSGRDITFVDTPGHAAFTAMRARGANVTDIVVLVVAADDGIMEQTVEAIHHAKAANVPIIVAINKIDRPEANPNRVRDELLQYELVAENYGGDIMTVEVSAKQRLNLDKLEEAILLQADMMELKANPNRPAEGAVVESKLDRGRGPVATVLVQKGTLRVGDIVLAGAAWGRVRALVNERGQALTDAKPATPVEIVGLNSAPTAGDHFVVLESEARAREIAEYRQRRHKEHLNASAARQSIEQLIHATKEDKKVLSVVVKSDVQGSLEAIVNGFHKFTHEEVSIQVLHSGVGGISEGDITLAKASQGMILGFNVRANPQARDLARRDNIPIRYYSVIYELLDDMKAALQGMLAPTLRERFLGNAEIREVFNISKVGKIAGCFVTEGTVKRGAKVRLLRDNTVIHEGSLKTLRRFKDEVKEVKESYECGMAFENYNDIRVGDIIECFEIEAIAREL